MTCSRTRPPPSGKARLSESVPLSVPCTDPPKGEPRGLPAGVLLLARVSSQGPSLEPFRAPGNTCDAEGKVRTGLNFSKHMPKSKTSLCPDAKTELTFPGRSPFMPLGNSTRRVTPFSAVHTHTPTYICVAQGICTFKFNPTMQSSQRPNLVPLCTNCQVPATSVLPGEGAAYLLCIRFCFKCNKPIIVIGKFTVYKFW